MKSLLRLVAAAHNYGLEAARGDRVARRRQTNLVRAHICAEEKPRADNAPAAPVTFMRDRRCSGQLEAARGRGMRRGERESLDPRHSVKSVYRARQMRWSPVGTRFDTDGSRALRPKCRCGKQKL